MSAAVAFTRIEPVEAQRSTAPQDAVPSKKGFHHVLRQTERDDPASELAEKVTEHAPEDGQIAPNAALLALLPPIPAPKTTVANTTTIPVTKPVLAPATELTIMVPTLAPVVPDAEQLADVAKTAKHEMAVLEDIALSPLQQAVVHDLIGGLTGKRPVARPIAPVIVPMNPLMTITVPQLHQPMLPLTVHEVAHPTSSKPIGLDTDTLEKIVVEQPVATGIRDPIRARGTERTPVIATKPTSSIAHDSSELPMIADTTPVRSGSPSAQPLPQLPLTPLEQAVHDLIANLEVTRDRSDDEPSPDAMMPNTLGVPQVALRAAPEALAPLAGPREIAPPAENQNPSHVHLVIDDGAERVVVTVAVRGNEVSVAMRGNDESTTASLARNAGSLDHAMRGRGLVLADLAADHRGDPRRERSQHDQKRRDRRDIEQFTLEEKA